jgi:hypothetical protein
MDLFIHHYSNRGIRLSVNDIQHHLPGFYTKTIQLFGIHGWSGTEKNFNAQ